MAEEDLGALMPLGANDPASTGGTWQDFVAKNRPFLAGMGAQLMTGVPGGVLANLGAGMAKGNESQFLTEENQRAHAMEERSFQAKQSEGDANRKSHEKIAETGAASREAVAELRGKYSVDRANIALQKAHPNDAIKYRTEARKIVEGRVSNLGLDTQTVSRMIEDEAARMYSSDVERGLVKAPANAPSGVGSATESKGAPSPTTTTPPPDDKGGPNPDLQKLINGKLGSQVLEKLKTSEGRNELIQMNPRLKQQIQLYEMALGATGNLGKP